MVKPLPSVEHLPPTVYSLCTHSMTEFT